MAQLHQVIAAGGTAGCWSPPAPFTASLLHNLHGCNTGMDSTNGARAKPVRESRRFGTIITS